jgi:uncharacterized membrane protein YoaK (UPF0700 family)
MHRFDRSQQALAIGIAALAGLVDAIGFLSADSYFVSFMSGNTTRLAVDLATAPARAVVPALLVCGFVAGVALGAIVSEKAGRWRKPVLLATVAALLFLGALLRALESSGGALAMMVLAMGAVNNAFRRDGEIAVGLTYMTGALVRLGQAIGAALMGERRSDWPAYLLLWCGLLGGAIAGALLFLRLGTLALWLAGLLAIALAMGGGVLARRTES